MSTEAQTQADQMKQVCRRIVADALNAKDVSTLDETHSQDATWHGPGGREIQGREGIKEMVSGYLAAFPDMQMTIENMVAEGDQVAMEWRAVGTHDGPLGDLPPTGKTIDIRGHLMARFEGGRIVQEHEIFDELAMLQQLGVAEG